jgi:hypothetical protein
MPAVYSIPEEAERQQATGFGTQITQFVPGTMAESVYDQMSHQNKLKLVSKMALAWQACWDLPLPPTRQIGELIATDQDGCIKLAIGPDRHFSLGGPFTSVREWLKARLRHALGCLERATWLDGYKAEHLTSIRSLVNSHLDQIPETVEICPIVAIHADMGLHNVIVSADDHTEIMAIIDWEFCASAPFLAAYQCIDRLFRKAAPNGYGPEFPQADELRAAFWEIIPRWKTQMEKQGAKDFLEWFRFALFMQPEHCSDENEKMRFWAENIRVVEHMVRKYSADTS